MMNTPSDFQTPAAPGMVNADQRPVDVVVLFSGGLDSILAAKVLEEQGLRVCCLHCHSPFFGDPGAVERWSNLYGLDIRALDVSDDFCAMLRARPAHGFGKVMNPCVDCKILLLRHARLYMESIGARRARSWGSVPCRSAGTCSTPSAAMPGCRTSCCVL